MSHYKYLALLITLLLVLVVYPVLRGPVGSPVLVNLLLTAVLLAGGWVVLADHRVRILGVVLGVPAVLGAWTGYTLPDLSRSVSGAAIHLSAAFFHILLVVVIVRGVYNEKKVSVDAIFGAICGYLVVGVAFGNIFSLVEVVLPGSFSGIQENTDGEQRHFLLTYFSFITLTTVGYGDITPLSGPARSLSVVEAITGQIYLTVLIADLIGKRVAQTLAPETPPK